MWRCLESAVSRMKHRYLPFPKALLYLEMVFMSSFCLMLAACMFVFCFVFVRKNIFLISSSFFVVLESLILNERNRKDICPAVFSV